MGEQDLVLLTDRPGSVSRSGPHRGSGPSEVACVILELTGEISVLRRGLPIDPGLVDGVKGSDRFPGDLLSPAKPTA